MVDIYRIRLKGRLDTHWQAWFGEFVLTTDEEGVTVLCGPVDDQAVLHGVLARIRDLGLPILSVTLLTLESPPDGSAS